MYFRLVTNIGQTAFYWGGAYWSQNEFIRMSEEQAQRLATVLGCSIENMKTGEIVLTSVVAGATFE